MMEELFREMLIDLYSVYSHNVFLNKRFSGDTGDFYTYKIEKIMHRDVTKLYYGTINYNTTIHQLFVNEMGSRKLLDD